jgi:hypothetical protein
MLPRSILGPRMLSIAEPTISVPKLLLSLRPGVSQAAAKDRQNEFVIDNYGLKIVGIFRLLCTHEGAQNEIDLLRFCYKFILHYGMIMSSL